MTPRFGRLYANAVLRPLAEQVVAELGMRSGETVCDLMCDGGTMGIAMGAAVGRQGRVLLVDTDPALVRSAMQDVMATGSGVSTAQGGISGLAAAESSCDRVASLCTLGFWDGTSTSLLEAASRVTRATGTAAVITWDSMHPPAHEGVLVDALREVVGIRSEFQTRCLASVDPVDSAGWEAVTLRDVVRFDGIAHYWTAMVVDRALATELAGESDDIAAALRAACQRRLQSSTAADGTMRIAVQATMWRRNSRGGA